jgi:hypothetical protein
MKRFIVAVVVALLSVSGAAELSAQSFLQKLGKAIESEVKSEVEKGVRKTVRNAMNQPLPKREPKKQEPKKQEPVEEVAQQPQDQPSAQPVINDDPSELKFYKPLASLSPKAKYVKDIDAWFRGGTKEGTYKMYKDNGKYYLDRKGEYHELFSCDAIINDVVYNHYYIFLDIELFIKEKIPGTPAPTVVRRE